MSRGQDANPALFLMANPKVAKKFFPNQTMQIVARLWRIGINTIAPHPPQPLYSNQYPQAPNQMVQQLTPETKPEIIYPDRDGEPIADNTKQFRWIVTIKENLEILFASILLKLNNNGSVQRKRSPNLNKNDSVIKLCYNKYSTKP